MADTPLTRAVLRTLAYFDIFDYPLTLEQLWRWLYPEPGAKVSASVEDVRRAVQTLVTDKRIVEHDGYIMLTDRQPITALRRARYELGQKKWKRARTVARFLEVLPFVRLAAVTNTLAIDNARDESDIDLLVVAQSNHIWITRWLVTGIVSMLGYRRHGDKIRNRVCLSFYITSRALDLSPLKAESDDVHFAFWTSQIVPLMDDRMYEKFQQANGWVTEQLPNAWKWDWKSRVIKPNKVLLSIKHSYSQVFGGLRGAQLEGWARTKQFDNASRDMKDNDVVVNEDVLKFHKADRRKQYNEAWRQRLRQLGLG